MRFTLSRATITNAMSESRFTGIRNYDAFFKSPLVTAEGASQVDIPLGVSDGARTVQPLPRRSWLPRKGGDAPDVMHVQVDQVWGDVIESTGRKRPLMHRVSAAVFVMDSSAKAKRDLQSAEAKHVTQSVPGSPDVGCATHPIFASSYTLVTINDPLRLELNNSSLMFLTRVSEEFTKLTSLMDDGSDRGHSFTFLAIDAINVSLYAEKHMLDPTTMTARFIEEQSTRVGNKPFHYVDISKLHMLSHNGNRVATQLYAIEDIGISTNAYETAASPVSIDEKSGVGGWGKVSLALRMRTPLATAEHTYRFYQQLDAVLLEKEAGPRDGSGSTTVETIQRQGNLGERRGSSSALRRPGPPSDGTNSMGDGGVGPDYIGSDLGPNLLYYLAAKKEGGKTRELELNFLPRSESKVEIRGLNVKTDSDTVALLSAVFDDYFPDDTFPPSAMQVTVIDTDVLLMDKAIYEAKSSEHFRLRSAEETATSFYKLDGVTAVRDGNRWAISTGEATRSDSNRGLKDIKKDEKVSRLQSELAAARELIAAQKLALEQAEATRASLLTALEEVKK